MLEMRTERGRWIKVDGEGYVALRHVVSLTPRGEETEWRMHIAMVDGRSTFLAKTFPSLVHTTAAIEELISGEDYD